MTALVPTHEGTFARGPSAVVDQFGQAASVVLAAAQVCHVESASVVLAADSVAQLCAPFLIQLSLEVVGDPHC